MADRTLAFSRTKDTQTVWLALYGTEGNKQPPLESFRLSKEHQWSFTNMLLQCVMQDRNVDEGETFCDLEGIKLTPSKLEIQTRYIENADLFEIAGWYFEKEVQISSFLSTYTTDEIWTLIKFMIPEPIPSKITKINEV